MNAKTTRLLKEARPLLLPWCAVTLAALMPLVKRLDFTVAISLIGFWAGIPLLASLSLGNEFQHRTFSLLLAQPVGRMEIWREKLSVTAVAVLSAALVFFFAWRVVPLGLERQEFPFVGAWIIGIFASATFWTLFTRSTLGGVVLNAGIHTFVILTTWNHLEDRDYGTGQLSPANVSIVPILSLVFLCYAGAMLWLGGRKLARFQVTGGMAGDDLLMAGPDVMPGALAGWFRCRPTGAIINLIRKELRLLRPLWLLTLLAVVVWTCVAMSGLVPERGSTSNQPSAVAFALGMSVISALILAVLAGSLSLGEERMSGTHAWHLTLPVSARRQWLVKLVMALFAGFVCAVLLPISILIAGGFVFGSPLIFADLHAAMVWMLYVLLLTFASFWCACAFNGTVRAVLWLFPALGALLLMAEFGAWVAPKVLDLVLSKVDLFTNFRFTNAVSNLQLFDLGGNFMVVVALILVPILIVAVIQSYRLFRAQAQDNLSSVIWNLLPMATVAFLCIFSLLAFNSLEEHAKRQMWTMFHETHEAIEKIQPGTPNLDAAHPLQLTVEDLSKTSVLSERTRRWLRNSRISVAPDKPQCHPGPYCCPGNSRSMSFAGDNPYSWYLASIHLANGSDCTLSFFGSRHGYGVLGGVCK